MNGTLFIDFNLAACDFFKLDLCKVLNSYTNFSFNILSLTINVVSIEILED